MARNKDSRTIELHKITLSNSSLMKHMSGKSSTNPEKLRTPSLDKRLASYTMPPLSLPTVPRLEPHLLAVGCSPEKCHRLSERFYSMVEKFRLTCELDYRKICDGSRAYSTPNDMHRVTYRVGQAMRIVFLRNVNAWQEVILRAVRSQSGERQIKGSGERCAFKSVSSQPVTRIALISLRNGHPTWIVFSLKTLTPHPRKR